MFSLFHPKERGNEKKKHSYQVYATVNNDCNRYGINVVNEKKNQQITA